MKKKLLCAAVAVAGGFSGSALAQSSVQVYGLVDTGVEYVTNVDALGNSLVKMPTQTGSFPSNVGFRGAEDLGGGLEAIFNLEAGYSVDTGTSQQGGRLFGRAANVGLKGSFGTVRFGRQVNMTYIAALKANIMGPHIHSISSFDGYLPNARSDNTIGYLGELEGFRFGATYSLGRDASAAGGPAGTNCPGEVPGNSKACRQVTGLLAYDTNSFGVASAYDVLYGNTGAAGGLTSSGFSDRRITLNGYAFLGTTKIGLGMIDRRVRTASDAKSALYFLGASQPFAESWILDGQVGMNNVKGSNNDSTIYVVRATYNLSKRTAVYSSVGYVKNDGTAALPVDSGGTAGPGLNQTGVMAGVRHTF
jgi:predicted porin